MNKQYRWFSFDRPLSEFALHATEEEARASAEAALAYYRDCAVDEGWPEGDTCVGYGRITALPVRVEVQTREEWENEHPDKDEDGEYEEPFPAEGFDGVYDLRLAPVPEEPKR